MFKNFLSKIINTDKNLIYCSFRIKFILILYLEYLKFLLNFFYLLQNSNIRKTYRLFFLSIQPLYNNIPSSVHTSLLVPINKFRGILNFRLILFGAFFCICIGQRKYTYLKDLTFEYFFSVCRYIISTINLIKNNGRDF